MVCPEETDLVKWDYGKPVPAPARRQNRDWLERTTECKVFKNHLKNFTDILLEKTSPRKPELVTPVLY